jgi:elongation factor P--(R)-beta-lysine ligase
MDWQPRANHETLRQRARLLGAARAFFHERGLLEVETPALVAHAVTDPHLANLKVPLSDGRTLFLHTSPEFHMKRLLAAGAPDIWQLGKVFRAGEAGPRHEPEFTLIEWYRVGFTLEAMARETCALLNCLGHAAGRPVPAPRTWTYRGIFREMLGVDPLEADMGALQACARARLGATLGDTLADEPAPDRDTWLDLLMSHVIAPSLAATDVAVISHFPASQAALARLDPGDPKVAERFEIYCRGIEVANGYRELTDATEQRQRFEQDRSTRRRLGFPDVAPDENLMAALGHGLPDCAGVAVGFDRVMMALLGLRSIQEAMSFPTSGS